MLSKFREGLVFGAGFAIAFIGIAATSLWLIRLMDSSDSQSRAELNSEFGPDPTWHSLSPDDQISASSAIAVLRYSESEGGSMTATISKLYRASPDIELNLSEGEVYPSLRYYPKDSFSMRSGAVVFFIDNPARYQHALYLYEDDRVSGYGNMPLSVLIEKFQAGT
jgi:hypothetical protein